MSELETLNWLAREKKQESHMSLRKASNELFQQHWNWTSKDKDSHGTKQLTIIFSQKIEDGRSQATLGYKLKGTASEAENNVLI